MPVNRPYKRTVRQFLDGRYKEGGQWMYVEHPLYATDMEHYLRAFGVIQKDLMSLFDFIEPADTNSDAYSFRIHELLTRTCIEVEANLTAILSDQGYSGKSSHWNMDDYRKVNQSHRLSSYRVKYPIWKGTLAVRAPFQAWASATDGLPWYQDYNAAKHDRHGSFSRAKFSSLIDAIGGLVVLLTSQFFNASVGSGDSYLLAEGPNDGFDESVANYYRVGLPHDWPNEERYDFAWSNLKNQSDPFAKFIYV